VFFDWAVSRQTDSNQILKWLGGEKARKTHNFNFNFLKFDVPVTIAAIVLSITVVGVAATKGFNWSIDFIGGTEVEVSFNQSVSPDELRAAALKADIHDLTIQGLKGGEQDYLLRFEEAKSHAGALTAAEKDAAHTSGGAKVNRLQDAIRQDLAAKAPNITRVDYVGPQIGNEMRNQGFISIFGTFQQRRGLVFLGLIIKELSRFLGLFSNDGGLERF
jgi:preprotein translocase subunit SecF